MATQQTKKNDGPTFHVLIKRADGEEVREVDEHEIMKLVDEPIEIFHTAEEAAKKKDDLARERILKAVRKERVKAKVARERAAFAGKHPEAAREFKRREDQARDDEKTFLAERSKKAAAAAQASQK